MTRSLTLNGQAGALLEVEAVTGTSIRVKNPANVSLALGTNAILRRWDGIGDLKANSPAELEDGVQIEFDGGTFGVGDYWLIPARTLTGKVEWPRNSSGVTTVRSASRNNPITTRRLHRLLRGKRIRVRRSGLPQAFPPLTAITARDVSYRPGECDNLQDTSTVQEALDVLCQGTGAARARKMAYTSKASFLPSARRSQRHFVPAGDLLKGIRIDCDERLFDGSVANKNRLAEPGLHGDRGSALAVQPTERQFWDVDAGAIIGFQPVTLARRGRVARTSFTWTPLPPTQKWLSDRLLQMYQEMTNDQSPRVLGSL